MVRAQKKNVETESKVSNCKTYEEEVNHLLARDILHGMKRVGFLKNSSRSPIIKRVQKTKRNASHYMNPWGSNLGYGAR